MELRDFAERCLSSPELEDKLSPPEEELTDWRPGAAVRPGLPARPADLAFAGRRQAPALPRPAALGDPAKRGLAHHILANHELQAVEVMAWMLLAFPDAPAEFRAGLGHIIQDEQRHTRMHIERAARLGVRFGQWPVNGYIWKQAQEFTSLLDYCAGLPLLFEARNLDHSLELAQQFASAGDERSAATMRAIHGDEVGHVAFGLDWLRRLKPAGLTDFDAFERHLHWPLRPAKARGNTFQAEARAAAGMSADFIARVAALPRERS